jgi:hypothetical protein
MNFHIAKDEDIGALARKTADPARRFEAVDR